MSSSDDDVYCKPLKPIKRRKYRNIDENQFENVNLYSKKVIPIISKTNEAILKQMNEG